MTYIISTRQLTETVAPVADPITLAEAKTHLRVDGTDSDTLITAQITAARQYIEKTIQRSMVQRTYRADVEGFAYRYRLPLPPLASISSIKYYTPDSPQVLTTLDANFYRADLGRSEIYMDASSASIPSIASRHDAVQITFVAGHAPDTSSPIDHAANVPEAIKAATKLLVADMYENRETSTPLKITQLPTVDRLLAAYREY